MNEEEKIGSVGFNVNLIFWRKKKNNDAGKEKQTEKKDTGSAMLYHVAIVYQVGRWGASVCVPWGRSDSRSARCS